MKNLFIKIGIVTVLIVFFVFVFNQILFQNQTVEAVGDISVDFGVNHTEPLFKITNIQPGDSITKTMHIYNDSSKSKKISLRGVLTSEKGIISHALTIAIKEDNRFVYGGQNIPKTLEDFFQESNGLNGVYLSSLSEGKSTTYTITIIFPDKSGNEYQNNRLVFDLQAGIVVELPKKCEKLLITGKPIYGTKRSDRLVGTDSNDLIIGYEGNDKIEGKGGDDCIIGGSGSDYIEGNSGNDILYGDDEYMDKNPTNLFHKRDRDILVGGSGYDTCYSGVKIQCEL